MAISARIDELRKKFDENPRRYFAPLANEYRKAGDPGQAIFICETYLPQQPGHMSGHIVFGQALYELNRLDEARTVFETALSLDPENLIALRHLGDIARKTGENSAARNWYQRVLEADPRNEEIAQIVASLAFAPDARPQSDAPEFGTTAETSTTAVIEPPDLSGGRDQRPTPVAGIGIVEHFDAGLGAPAISAAAPPPPTILSPPTRSVIDTLFGLDDSAPAEIRLSGPTPQLRTEATAPAPVPFVPETIAPPAPVPFVPETIASPPPAFDLHAVDDDRTAAAPEPVFEEDSLAIATPSAPSPTPPEDDGHLDGAFVDESAFEPFSLGSPVPEIEEAPSAQGDQSAATIPSVPSPGEGVAASGDAAAAPPPLPFDAVNASSAETPGETAPAEEELASFLAQHAPHEPEAPVSAAPAIKSATGDSAAIDGHETASGAPSISADEAAAVGGTEHAAPAALPLSNETQVETPAAELPHEAAETPIEMAAAAQPTEAVAVEAVAVEAVAVEAVAAEAVAAEALSDEVAEPLQPSDAFATETMAELYLQQGHLEPALDIYKKLVEQRPDDAQLHERLGAIERKLYGVAAAARESEAVRAEPAGPTIREFLSAFATRAGAAASGDHDAGAAVQAHDGASPEATAPDVGGIRASETGATSAVADHGSIDALFAGADASLPDANAAAILAEAFAPGDGPHVSAMPDMSDSAATHADASPPASAEALENAATASDGFSFDQFFAGGANRSEPAAPRDAEPAPGDAADVAQFNQWLSGLKKPS